MRATLRLFGTVLIATSVLGLGALAYLAATPEPSVPPRSSVGGAGGGLPFLFDHGPTLVHGEASIPISSEPEATDSITQATIEPDSAITHIEISRIGLSADVVAAPLIDRDGGTTWQVPAFKVGHAESTPGAGQPGNAVLLGHVTSLRSGNVFADLDQAQVGDTVWVRSEHDDFEYRVVAMRSVNRGDTSPLDQSGPSAVTMITCTGTWLPTIWDYTQRLVVRAELAGRG